MEPLIEIKNLSVIYKLGTAAEFTALRNVNIQIYEGEYVIFYGPSGCGKSTLLYCLAGLEVPTSGEIFIKGKPLSGFSHKEMVSYRRTGIGMIFQAYNLITTLSVLDNVSLPNIFMGYDEGMRIEKSKVLLKKFDVLQLARRYPNELSGGQQQRVAIARSLIDWPPILFADEPVGNLDSVSASNVMDNLVELNEKNKKTIILVTHDPSYLSYGHRVIHMKDGMVSREAINSEKKAIAPEKDRAVSTSLDALSQLHPSLPEIQLKAKALAQYLLNSFDELEIKRLEEFIVKRISGEIGEIDFINLLDKPFDEGGAGFYSQTAQNFSRKIEKILSEVDFLKKKIIQVKRPLTEVDFKVEELRKYLLNDSKVFFKKEEEINRLNHCINLRITNRIDRKKFQKHLDLSFVKGGVGLNRRTAKNLTKKLEMILIQ